MNIETAIYLANILPNLGLIAIPGIILLTVSSFIFLFSLDKNMIDYETGNKIRNKCKFFIPFSCVLILISMLIPSEKTVYLMLGANYLKNSMLPSKVEMAIEKKIDGYLVEGKT